MKHFLLGAVLISAAVLPVRAHHAFAAEFDMTKPLTLTGTVTKLEWMNPHIWLYLDVKADAAVHNWQCEGGAPNTLTRNGWSKESLKSGDQVYVEGFQARDGTKTCNMRVVKLPDGRTVFAGPQAGATPPKK